MATAPTNVIIIHRAFQVLNASEYARRARLSPCRLIVIEDEALSREYFAEIADPGVFDVIDVVPLRDWYRYPDLSERRPGNLAERLGEKVQLCNDVKKRYTIDRLAQRVGTVNELVLGSYRRSYAGYMRHLANRIPHNKLVLIDVGTDTLEICRQRREEWALAGSAPPGDAAETRSASSFRRRFVDWDTRGVNSLTFFSSYDLDVSPSDHLISNDYRHVRSALGNRERDDRIWFLGQPIADQQYLSWASYKKLIATVVDHYGVDRFHYIAHPYESQDQINEVLAAGATVERFPKPVEIMLGQEKTTPALVTGFFSSAIAGCAAIFGSSLRYEAVRIPDGTLEKQRDNLREIYESFAAHKPDPITVVALEVE